MKFTVLFQNVEILLDIFAKLNKKAEKFNVEKIWFKLDGKPYENEYKEEVIDIEVRGVYPVVGDYKLVAVLEYFEGKNLIKAIPGEELPVEYRDNDFFCDHCGINRARKEVVVVKNVETGEYKQVGKTCLKDFLGRDLESLVQLYGYLTDAIEKAGNPDSDFGSLNFSKVASTERFVQILAKVMRKVGYKSKRDCEYGGLSTSNLMADILFGCGRKSYSFELMVEHELKDIEDCDKEYAAKVLDWVRSIEGKTDFEYNLKTIMSSDSLNMKHFGYASCVIASYQRHVEKIEAEKKAKDNSSSDWVGEVKKRLDFDVECLAVRTFDGYYGPTTMVRFIDSDDNILVWFGSGEIDWIEVGGKYSIKGTVKKHDEYKGIKQTVISRVKPVDVAV